MFKYITHLYKPTPRLLQIRTCTDPCAPDPPEQECCTPCPPCPQYPPFYCCPRTKYDVNFIYVNDKPPNTTLKDFVDRASQTLFWTEIARGKLNVYMYEK